jgi:hypothetical protein
LNLAMVGRLGKAVQRVLYPAAMRTWFITATRIGEAVLEATKNLLTRTA